MVLSTFTFQTSYSSIFSPLLIPLVQFGRHIFPWLNPPVLLSPASHIVYSWCSAFQAWCYCKTIYQLDRIRPPNRIIYTFVQLSPNSPRPLRLFSKSIFPAFIDFLVSSLLLATQKLEISRFLRNITLDWEKKLLWILYCF